MNESSSMIVTKFRDSNEENSSIQKSIIYTNKILDSSSDIKKSNFNISSTKDKDSVIDTNKDEKNNDSDNDCNCSFKIIEDERIKVEEEENYDEKKKLIFTNSSKDKIKFLIKNTKIRTHYFKNAAGEIFSYRYRSNTNKEPFLFTCCKKNVRCCAKVRCFNNFALIVFVGYHSHSDGIEGPRFYKKYPFLHRETWKHIQMFETKDRDIVVRLS